MLLMLVMASACGVGLAGELGDGAPPPEPIDAPVSIDQPTELDAGTPALDAGATTSPRDAGVAVVDAGTVDAGVAPLVDGGVAPTPDAGAPTAPDAGTPDAGTPDAGAADAGAPDAGAPDAGAPLPGRVLWVSGYYPGWVRSTLPPTDIDYRALTHLVDFSMHPRTDGTLEDTHSILGVSGATIAAAHAGGAKVLLCVGGANTAAGFRGATTPANLTAFVDNIVSTVVTHGYDGVDLDWEPLPSSDRAQYVAMVNALQARLAALSPRRALTAAVDSWAASTLAAVADRFDQVNVMTYDMANNSSDWVTWFNSPLSGGGATKPSGALLPAADISVDRFRTAGIAAAKLGIGIAFYGNLWSGGAGTSTGGASAPGQSWTTAPTMTAIDYRTIRTTWYQPGRYHLDPVTGSAWLGVDQPGSADDRFITFDDESTIARKLAWAKVNGLGGVIIWQLAGGWLPATSSPRDPLLQAVRANR